MEDAAACEPKDGGEMRAALAQARLRVCASACISIKRNAARRYLVLLVEMASPKSSEFKFLINGHLVDGCGSAFPVINGLPSRYFLR